MYLPELCIKRPIFTIVISLVILSVGLIFFTKLEIRSTPNISFPMINLQAYYDGASASYMEDQITKTIEKPLKIIKNLKDIISESSAGSCSISLIFDIDADIEIALNDVRSAVSEIIGRLPDDMKPPTISKMDADAWPSLWVSISSDIYDELELTRIADENINYVLQKLPTVGKSVIYGSRYYSMRIEPIMSKLYQHKITPHDIELAVRSQNKNYPAGEIKTNSRNFSVNIDCKLNEVDDFKEIIIKTYPDASVIKLGDIAKIELAPYQSDIILRYNGKQSLAIGLIKQSTANIINLSDSVYKELPEIRKNLPNGVKIEIAYDASVAVRKSINSVYSTIFEAIGLVAIVIYIFLGSLRLTIIPLLTIPISLIGTFAVMYNLGFSINAFTLLAMVLAIGLVVDDAIVMLENIFRHKYELKKTPLRAAISGSKEISFAIIAMTITLASVFLPVGFIEGFLGKLFIEFAWTLAICVIISGIVALTLTPMMSSRMIKDKQIKKNYFLRKFDIFMLHTQYYYVRSLSSILNHKIKFYLISSISILGLVFALMKLDKTFVPNEDQGFIQLFFSGPEGSSSEQTLKSVIEAEKIVKTIPDVRDFFVVAGTNGGEAAMAFLPLQDWKLRAHDQTEVQLELNKKLSAIPGMSIFATSPPSIGGGGGGNKPVEFYITTSNLYDRLDIISENFLNKMKASKLFTNPERDFKASTPTLNINIDREKAYRYGADLDIIGKTIQYLISGRSVGDFKLGNDIYEVILKTNIENRKSSSDLKKIFIKSRNDDMLPLENLATIEEMITIKEYMHYNNMRAVKMSSNIGTNTTLEHAKLEIEKIASEILDFRSKIVFTGQIKQMEDSSKDSLLIFAFALLFIFLVLSAQFESFRDSILILASVPFSITGGILALLLFNNSLNIYSNIGLVTLIGLVTKNAIMIVEFTNQLLHKKYQLRQAILEASRLRLRPILMTSIATICGAIPLITAHGPGAAARNSIGIVVVGGMLIGTIFTIYVIPVLFHSFKKVN